MLPAQQESGPGDLVRSLIFPAILFGGLFLLSRGSGQGQGGGMGGMGGMGGPMDLSRSGAKVQMQPDTGVTFGDVVGVDGGALLPSGVLYKSCCTCSDAETSLVVLGPMLRFVSLLCEYPNVVDSIRMLFIKIVLSGVCIFC